MARKVDWFFSIVRIAGTAFPLTAWLVQLQAEIDSKTMAERVAKLEDPVSFLHPDVPELSQKIYQELKKKEASENIEFDRDFYSRYSRALAILESQGYIKGLHSLANLYDGGISVVDPSYIMYLCAVAEDGEKMEALIKRVEECQIGEWLDGYNIQKSIDLPIPVIKAVFQIYESKGYGTLSREVHSCQYLGRA